MNEKRNLWDVNPGLPFFVFVRGKGGPITQHRAYVEAEAEAKRLTRKEGQEAVVYGPLVGYQQVACPIVMTDYR